MIGVEPHRRRLAGGGRGRRDCAGSRTPTDILAFYEVTARRRRRPRVVPAAGRYVRGDAGGGLSDDRSRPTPVPRRGPQLGPMASGRPQPANLADILERVLDKGIVIAGDIRVNLLDIELLTIKIRLLVASVDKAQEMGIDWWEHDPMLSSSEQRAGRGEPTAPRAPRGAGVGGSKLGGPGPSTRPLTERAADATSTPSPAARRAALDAMSRGCGDGAPRRARAPRPAGGRQRRRPRRVRRGSAARNLEDLPWLEEVGPRPRRRRAGARRGDRSPRCAWPRSARRRQRARAARRVVRRARAGLDRVEGRQEWSVKAFAVPAPAEPAEAATTAGARPRGGLPAAEAARRATGRARSEERCTTRPRSCTSGCSRRRPAEPPLLPQDPRLTGPPGTDAPQWAYLVEPSASAELHAAARRRWRSPHPRSCIDPARGRRTRSRPWSIMTSRRRDRRGEPTCRPASRSPWSTCSIVCSAPGWSSRATW